MAKILFLIIGFKKPSSRKRVLDSVEYLRARGHVADVAEVPSGAGRAAMLVNCARYDLVVLQKKLFGSLQLELLRRANPNIVYDMDDAVMFHELERGEPVTGKFFRRFAETAAACKGVIAGNEYLAGFARAARKGGEGVIVLPTPVDTDAISPKRYTAKDKATIGWIGTKGNLGHLRTLAGPLRELLSGGSARLKVVCDRPPEIPGVTAEFKPWSAQDEMADLHSFDVGVMPLIDNLWTRGKGGFKLLQYMAAGVPAVASPVGINAEIIRHGENGFLAGNEREWADTLGRLCADPALRESIGQAGRRTAEDVYSLREYNRRLGEFLESFL